MFDFFNNGLQLIQTGAVGAMLVATWKMLSEKDKKIYSIIEQQNQEREKLYEGMKELVKETTYALSSKNMTDDRLSETTNRLTEQIKEIRKIMDTSGGNNEAK